MKKNLPGNKSEKEIYSTKKLIIKNVQKRKNMIQEKASKTTSLKKFHTNDTICMETDEQNDISFVFTTEEICHAIIYKEIFNRKFYS